MESLFETEGFVFKIKRFSLHDGPGIRTSVFLKGCPLNCIWCHSPEGISQDISIWYNSNLCIHCGQCIKVCPEGALALISDNESYIKIDRELCRASGECVTICPSNALQFTGYKSSVSGIISEIEKDATFYLASGGGITLTGGEPLYQPEFVKEILEECRKRMIHTALETSLFCEKDTLELISPLVDMFIVDLKIFDSASHKYYTGKVNETIKENFHYIALQGKDILVRIPLIANITDVKENITAITDFVRETRKDIQIELISYNPLAENNYKKLGIPFLLK